MIKALKTKTAEYPQLTLTTDFPDLVVNPFFYNLRKTEFARLDQTNQIYLDYTGGGLYAQSQLDQHFESLSKNVFGNPHSINPTSALASNEVMAARKKVMDYFNAGDEYVCVFTANASAALKIVGECYPFMDKGHFLLSYDNHNSVNGIREYCTSRGGSYEYSPIYLENLRMDEALLFEKLAGNRDKENKLFAFPAQSNVSGVKHPLSYVKKAQDQGWDVLLDAAAFVPSDKLDLQEIQPEFVSVSFYKIFGYPTGLGCLFIKKSVFGKLKKPWFAGGTVSFVSINTAGHFLHTNHERFENGTINYLDIPAIKTGLEFIESIGIERINNRVHQLCDLLLKEMMALKYSNGQHLVNILGPAECKDRGGTIIFNLFDAEGEVVSYFKVEEDARDHNISLRTGCFCNPGIDEIMSCVSPQESLQYYTLFDGDVSYEKIASHLGRLRGAIRISVGHVTNLHDLNTFIGFLKGYLNK